MSYKGREITYSLSINLVEQTGPIILVLGLKPYGEVFQWNARYNNYE